MPALRACWSSNDDTCTSIMCLCLCVYILYMPTELQINKNYTTVVLMVYNIFIEYLLNNIIIILKYMMNLLLKLQYL